jgi:hypothetical protein
MFSEWDDVIYSWRGVPVNGMMLYNLGGVFSEWDDVIKSWRSVQ